jgi:uncharacterized protein (DUF1778 family)
MINIRIKPTERDLIDQAAAAQGSCGSDFWRAGARRAAREALLDQTLILVDDEAYARFVALLDAPPKPNPALRKLMQTAAPWE